MLKPVTPKPIHLSRIPLRSVRTIKTERGWGGHFHTFLVLRFCPRPQLGAIVRRSAEKVYMQKRAKKCCSSEDEVSLCSPQYNKNVFTWQNFHGCNLPI